MTMGALSGWVLATLLVSLRLSPVFALAPPFTLTRVPARFRMLFGLALAACVASGRPDVAAVSGLDAGGFAVAALRELFLGAMVVLVFQVVFAGLYVAGRTVDVQAGFGLATLIDPTSKAQTPLVGTLLAYAAGIVFFAMNGHLELLRILGASFDAVPLGSAAPLPSVARVGAFLSTSFVASLGVAGGAILCLFLSDLAIALLSRTAPQMNVLVFGFQIKTILLFVLLPATFGVAAALLARLVRIALESLPGLL